MTHSMLPLQRLVILLGSRLSPWLLRWLGQPPVVGEMIAGLAPGPRMFGALAPSGGCRPASAALWILPTGLPDALILPMLLYYTRRQPAAIKRSTSAVHD